MKLGVEIFPPERQQSQLYEYYVTLLFSSNTMYIYRIKNKPSAAMFEYDSQKDHLVATGRNCAPITVLEGEVFNELDRYLRHSIAIF